MLTKNNHQQVAWLLFVGIIASYLLMAFKFPHAYIIATYEDLVGEWAQFFFFATTMLLAARQAIISEKFRLFFSALALACLYVAGEEISWGQRLLNLSTPEFFNEHNLQKETNLHNFFTGPISTHLKQALEYAIAAGLIGYGLVYPWLLQRKVRWAQWLEGHGLAAPPLYLCPFFVVSGLLEIGLFHFNEAEIAEVLIPLALGIMTLSYRSASLQKIDIHDHPVWDKLPSRKLAGQTLLLFFTVITLALGTTFACYSSPRLGAEMTDRYLNGIDKFAGRYMRFGQWEIAAGLYHEVDEFDSGRASVQRNLFRCYDQLGKPEQSQQALSRAIEIDEQRLVKNPSSISARISLVRNYQLVDDLSKAHYYLQQALETGLSKKNTDPQDPGTAYWLGRSYTLQGDYVSALQEFRRAVELNPQSLRYRKALIRTRDLLNEKEEKV